MSALKQLLRLEYGALFFVTFFRKGAVYAVR